MSKSRLVLPGFIVAAIVGLAAIVDVASAETKYPVHYLTTSAGIHFVQTFDGKVLRAHVETPKGPVPLPDGPHKLTNGGEIKVVQGVIVWDAFGVVEKVKKGQYADPTG